MTQVSYSKWTLNPPPITITQIVLYKSRAHYSHDGNGRRALVNPSNNTKKRIDLITTYGTCLCCNDMDCVIYTKARGLQGSAAVRYTQRCYEVY